MIDRVTEFIETHKMLNENDKVIVGVSGGADSVCLLFMLTEIKKKLPVELIAVYVEHGLRGLESEADGQFVEELCRSWQIQFERYQYQAGKIARERKLSVEEAGREIRYQAFGKALKKYHADKIAVAHNKNDQGETILMNLFRGSGLKGIGGITPVRDSVIRPLLCLTRMEIEQVLEQEKIPYRIDSSNNEDYYTRNKVRMHIIPYVEKEINNKAVEHLARSSAQMQCIESYLQRQAEAARREVSKKSDGVIKINCRDFLVLDPVIQGYLLYQSVEEITGARKDIQAIHIETLHRLMTKQVGSSIDLPYQCYAEKKYEEVWLVRKTEPKETQPVSIDVKVPGICEIERLDTRIYFSIENAGKVPDIEGKIYTKCFNCDIINGNLQIRTRKSGDYLVVNKDGGRKKLKDYFIDCKIPKEQRDEILLLADGSHILWIIGGRISEAYKVTRDTTKILRVRMDGGSTNVRNY